MDEALGRAAVILGLVGSVAGVATLVAGLVRGKVQLLRAGRNYVWLVLGGAVLATVAMQHALVTHDFRIAYVADNDSLQTPLLYTVTAMWSALRGSILLWSLILSGYIALMSFRFRNRIADPLVGWALVVSLAVSTFFFGLMATSSNPFVEVVGKIPTNGPGPDPLLQNNPLVTIHPPLLYLGVVGFTIPFSFAVASLITGRVGEGWLVETRRWTLFAWGFLTVGIILGAWWSYQVLGWGGYWSWDPVENSAFLPWLTATAYLHSVMVQERRGMLRVWNLSLLMATFSLTILGTFLTRSGVVESVHSFSDSDIGPELLAFFGVVVALAVGLIAWRGERLRSPGTIDSPFSREGAFLANNLLFGAFAFVVLLGTVFPLIAEAVNGEQITVGSPYFNSMTLPIVICLLFLMAVAPVLPWRKASGELLRHRLSWPAAAGVATVAVSVASGIRGLAPLVAFGLAAFAGASAIRQLVLATRRQGPRGLLGRANGGMIVHLGVIMIAVAFAASHAFGHQTTLSLEPGQTAGFDGHTFTYLGTSRVDYPNRVAIEAAIQVDHGQIRRPAITTFALSSTAVPTPSIDTSARQDVYLTLNLPPASYTSRTDQAKIGVIIQPLVSWLWVGGGVILGGTILAAWPGRRRRKPTQPVSAAVPGVGLDHLGVPDSEGDQVETSVGAGAGH
jgi:cytochrome c-type biogenesis protein CcmF